MKLYKKLFLSLSLLIFISCGSSGGSNSKPTLPLNTNKREASKIEASKIEASKIEASKVEASKIEAPKIEASKIEAPKIEASKIEASKIEAPKVEASKIDILKRKAPKREPLKTKISKREAPQRKSLKIKVSKTKVPKTVIIENVGLYTTLKPKSLGTTIFNGNININDETSIGAIANQKINLINSKLSTITGNMNIGMKSKNKGSVINDGEINGNIEIGIDAEDDGEATNNGNINLINNESEDDSGYQDTEDDTLNKNIIYIGMKANNGGFVTNGVEGKIIGDINYGIAVNKGESKGINYGTINIKGTNSYKVYLDNSYQDEEYKELSKETIGMYASYGGFIINKEGANISGNLSNGMYVEGLKTIAINNGEIKTNGAILKSTTHYRNDNSNEYSYEISAEGMSAEDGSIINGEKGKILGRLSDGMYISGINSKAINNGLIIGEGYYKVSRDNPFKVEQTPSPENLSKDKLNKLGIGMEEDEGGEIINGKTGAIQGNFSVGMKLNSDGISSKATNNGNIIYDQNILLDNPRFTGMLGYKNSEIINNGNISLFDKSKNYNNSFIGIESESNVLNTGNISGDFDKGIEVSVRHIPQNEIQIINEGDIKLSANNAIGISIENSSSKIVKGINKASGNIYLNGRDQIGMYASGKNAIIENDGNIYLSGTMDKDYRTTDEEKSLSYLGAFNGKDSKGNIGMSIMDGATMINKGIIHFSMPKQVLNINNDLIPEETKWNMLSLDESMFVPKKNGILTLNKNININDEISTGVISNKGTEIINSKDNSIIGNMAIGMNSSSGEEVINRGSIRGNIEIGILTSGNKSLGINSGKLNLLGNRTNSIETVIGDFDYKYTDTFKKNIGMEARGNSLVINTLNGNISGKLSIGMLSTGKDASAINHGNILSKGNIYDSKLPLYNWETYRIAYTGMSAQKGSSIINSESGKITGALLRGMFAEGTETTKFSMEPKDEAIALNNGHIKGTKYYEINVNNYIDDELKIHTQKINKNNPNASGSGMYGNKGAKIVNGKTGIIDGDFCYGMKLGQTGTNTAINEGKIISNGSLGDYSNFVGISGFDNTNIINTGDIISRNKGTGIESYYKAINTGNISGNFYNGITLYKGVALNRGNIDLTRDTVKNSIFVGMSTISGMSGCSNSIAVNEATGNIYLNGKNQIGMNTYGDEAIVENNGNINMSKNGDIGIAVNSGANGINGTGGKIYLNGSNQIGMYAAGDGSIIENDGDIYLSGTVENNSTKTDGKTSDLNSGISICNGKDNKGNIGMKIENGAIMINKGTIHFAQSK